jgi:hypothetical protein
VPAFFPLGAHYVHIRRANDRIMREVATLSAAARASVGWWLDVQSREPPA